MFFTRLMAEIQFFAICSTKVKILDQKKVLIKQLLLRFMAQFLQFLIFMKMTIFSGTLVESSEFVHSLLNFGFEKKGYF